MPVYEYQCPYCGLKFEKLRPMSQADEDCPCPRCNNGARRTISNFSAFSKGTGGETAPVGGGSSCSGCTSGTCSSCH